ncbi:MAG TPA: NADH-quinone oxidoreductase subunit N [Bryobacteraceae bacterium]
MLTNYLPPGADYLRFLPEIILTAFGLAIMMLEPFTPVRRKSSLGVLALVGIAAAFATDCWAYFYAGPAFHNMIVIDGYTTFFRALVLVVGFLCILPSFSYLSRENAQSGEYYALILFSLVGQCVLVGAINLIMVFIGLEISSIATYVLAGFLRTDRRNNESSLKYFLLGSFATAFLLYGIAWIYGLTGSTNLNVIRQVLERSSPHTGLLPGIAAALIFVGFAFKVSVAPFQVWAPDVYQGASAPIAAFMSSAPKAAAFAVFFRVFIDSFTPLNGSWMPLMWGCALATLIIGNIAALMQTNVKRLLGYSSVAHAGYVLIALTADSQIGTQAAMFYLGSYVLMNIGAFIVIGHVAAHNERFVLIKDLSGLSHRQPVTAALLAVFVFSLVGVPLTGGFFGKFYVFQAALDSHLVVLTVLGLITSAIAAFYYLKLLVAAYMHEPSPAVETLGPPATGVHVAMWAAALGTLFLGIFPAPLVAFISASASVIR